MRLTDSPEEAAWRSKVRDFLQKELPEQLRPRRGDDPQAAMAAAFGERGGEERGRPQARAGGSGFQLARGAMGEWREKLATQGWIAPAWPKEYGGAGLSTMEQFILNEEFAEARA